MLRLSPAERADRELRPLLTRWVRGRVRDDATAEDLVQTVLLRVHERQEQLNDTERLAPWVWRITRNAVIDHHRRARPNEAWDDQVAAPEDTADAEIAGLATWLAWEIDALPPVYRDALRMTELDGLTMREASEQLGLSVSVVKSRVQRGRAMLKQRLLRCCAVELDHAGRVVDFRRKGGPCETC